MRMPILVAAAALLAPHLAQAAITTDTVRQQAEQACYNNVMAFCNDDVPDEDKIKACMTRNRMKLDADCREIFDRGMKLSK